MSNQNLHSDIIIVGCGPVGATLALFLKRYGYKVTIFDREADIFPEPRAYVLDEESMRIMQTLGLSDRLWDEGHVYHTEQWICSKDEVLLNMGRHNLGDDFLFGRCGHHQLTCFHQPSLEKILREVIQEGPYPVDVFLEHEVFEFHQNTDEASVVVRDLKTDKVSTFTGKFIVGCDGAKSKLKREIGGGQTDLKYEENYLVVDAQATDPIYFKSYIRQGAFPIFDRELAGVRYAGPHNYLRLDFLQHKNVVGEKFESKEELYAGALRLFEVMGLDADKFDIKRSASYTFKAIMANSWRKGRWLIAGDAAHLTPPWAGQGLNMGIRDCSNLSFKLKMILSGQAEESLLDTYFEERGPASLITIQSAIDAGKSMQQSSVVTNAVSSIMMTLAKKIPAVARLVSGRLQQRPPYKSGLLGGKHKTSGSIMIQPRLTTMRGDPILLDDMIGQNFVLLSLTSHVGPSIYRFIAELGGEVYKFDYDFLDPEGKLLSWFKKNKVNAVLLRPDRYIFDAGNDGEELCAALLTSLEK